VGTNKDTGYQKQRTSCSARKGVVGDEVSIPKEHEGGIVGGEPTVDKDTKLKDNTECGNDIKLSPAYLIVNIEREVWCVGVGISNDDDRRVALRFLRIRVVTNFLFIGISKTFLYVVFSFNAVAGVIALSGRFRLGDRIGLANFLGFVSTRTLLGFPRLLRAEDTLSNGGGP
jgi:hypothetical protein